MLSVWKWKTNPAAFAGWGPCCHPRPTPRTEGRLSEEAGVEVFRLHGIKQDSWQVVQYNRLGTSRVGFVLLHVYTT